MRVRKALFTGVLLAAPVLLGPAGAAHAVAAETATVVEGEPSKPGGFSMATCPSGTHLTGGGYQWTPEDDADRVVYNGPSMDATTWGAKASHGSVLAYAVCETE
ncbi:hypothetical protein [Kitasatospora brasiliensis]|uniref:hypothetical protein n=1 Tax=Kitasatospora brasiliensis TaxID=3058040 RepID=UPI00293018F0|nr:hypothetical protein [Kitasatospora sp. K002]